MKTKINYITGAVEFTPESKEDRRLLFHIMNCSTLKNFSEYLKHELPEVYPIPDDIGVPVEHLDRYPLATQWERLAEIECKVLDWKTGQPLH